MAVVAALVAGVIVLLAQLPVEGVTQTCESIATATDKTCKNSRTGDRDSLPGR
jgi:hypothetical protein